MTKKLTTLAQIRDALRDPSARLVYDERRSVQAYFVEDAGDRRTPCTKVADRLTWRWPNSEVEIVDRRPLEIHYQLKR